MHADSDFLLSVPVALATRAPGLTLHLRVDSVTELTASLDGLPWDRIREVTLPALEDISALGDRGEGVSIRLWWRGDLDVGRLLDLHPELRRLRAMLLIDAQDPHLYEKALVGESLALTMSVAMAEPDSVDLAELNRLISYVLIAQAERAVRIQPLASMINALASSESYTLFHHAKERVRHDLYVGGDGVVSLSERLLESHPYATLDELPGLDLTGLSSFSRLDGYVEGLFRAQSQCSTCRTFPLCGGWLRLQDPGYDCELWRLVLDAMADAVGERERARRLARGAGRGAQRGRAVAPRRADTGSR